MNQLEEYFKANPVILKKGVHKSPECGACILEVCSVVLGVDWTDDPTALNLPDIRGLNDARWSTDELRTEQMMRVGVAIWSWRDASNEQKTRFARKLAELTIRRVLPDVLESVGLREEAKRCREEGTAEAADAYAAYAAKYAAYSAN